MSWPDRLRRGAGRPPDLIRPRAVSDTNLVRFRAAVAGALAHLESRREEVNDLNVFPVADGDTGDNMALTLRAVLAELDRLLGANGETRTIDEIGREEVVQSVARAALLGARGNSGVILSQLIRGAAEELVSRPGQLIDATLIGAALANAADRAYASVREPAEGTILTVAREMAHQIMTDVAHSPDSRLGPATDPLIQDAAIADALERAVVSGQESVKRSPELLAALREAGVVDAGGYGLTIIFAGVVAALRGEDAPELDHHAPAQITHPQHVSGTYRFCTNFAVTGSGLSAGRFIAPLEALGDSVLVVGDERTLKVHVHTDEPERATAVFADAGEISRLDIADMRLQVAERDERLHGSGVDNGAREGAVVPGVSTPQARCGALAVVSGDGVAAMFEELGVCTIDGGPTLNPSTYELLAAIHEVPAEEVLVLPSSPNVVMAAERAAELSDKRVLVAPAAGQQAGLVAAVALEADRGVEENARALVGALAHVRTGAVAQAARDDVQGRFRCGEAVGFVGEDVHAWGDPAQTLGAVISTLAQDAELISCLAGEGAPLGREEVQAMVNGNVELELRDGGQHAYWWLLTAE
jgi:DAK2 domain fusion protein YloV